NRPGAWDEMKQLYAPWVQGRIAHRLRRHGRADDAPDIVARVLGAVAGRFGNFQRQRPGDTFRGWIWKIAEFKLADYWRQQPLFRSLPEGHDPAEERDDADADDGEMVGLLRRALERIRPEFSNRDWDIFLRLWDSSQTAAAIAGEYGTTANVVFKV